MRVGLLLIVVSTALGCATRAHPPPPEDYDVGPRRDSSADTRVDAKADTRDGTVLDGADVGEAGIDEVGDASDDGDDADADPLPDADAEIYDPPWDGAISCDPGDASTDAPKGTTFCEIYVDIISPVGSAKCQSSGCHGGAIGINKMAMGWTGDSCYKALTTHSVVWLPPNRVVFPVPGGDSRPKSLLPILVDPASDAGLLMPWLKEDAGNRLLDSTERARIDAWLARGAPFD